jgi:hypothetical protein
MKLELFIFGITAFLIYNTYHDNKYSKMLIAYKKYYQIIFIGFVALSIYLLIKRNPLQSKNLLLYANNAVKYMPLDKSSVDLISPIFDLSSRGNRSFMEDYNNTINPYLNTNTHLIPQQQRNLLSGPKPTKRSVSETKKKYVASIQDWKCGQCSNKLTHTFEVDHKIRLEHGGSNDVTNLVALCRECHGQKTALENM